jgi:hypothetical protein
VDVPLLMELQGLDELGKLQQARAEWVKSQLEGDNRRDASWTESIATGDAEF